MYIRHLLFSVLIASLLVFAGCTSANYQVSVSSAPADGGTVNPTGGTYEGGKK